MIIVLLFGIALLFAVLISGIAERTVLSIAAIFLIIGFLAGQGVIGLVQINTDSQQLFSFVRVAMVAILFTDGMKIGKDDLLGVWMLPGRALLLGLPMTLLIMALLAHLILGLTWLESFLVSAVLSPTDPVFTSSIISKKVVPVRLRRLLNVESGINDGIALPIVLAVLALLGVEEFELGKWLLEIGIGIGVGICIPWVVLTLKKIEIFSIARIYMPLLGLAIVVLVFSLTELLKANSFLAAFFAGVTVATIDPDVRNNFLEYGELLSRLFKLGGVLLFGALLKLNTFFQVQPMIYLYTVLVLILARPIAINLSLLGTRTNWRDRLVASWFGPRGFASVVYGLLVLSSGIPHARDLFLLIAVVVTGSILVHSSSDGLVVRYYQNIEDQMETQQEPGRLGSSDQA